jgi:predicted Zn-dependent peptidase
MSRRSTFLSAVVLSTLGLVACGGPTPASTGPGKVDLPVTDGIARSAKSQGPKRQSPPPSGTPRDFAFPAVARSKLANGMGLDVVTVRTLPVVQVRLVVRAGAGYGALPGVGEITAQMLKDGGTRAMSSAEVLRRVETLGSNLSVRSELDATVLGMELTKDKVGDGLAILSQVVREPRFDAEELRKLKARSIDEAEDAARSDGNFTATWLVFHELFPPTHPYHVFGALPSQIAKIDGARVREHHNKLFVPKNATLVFAGDIDEATAKELTQKHFGSWTGGDPPKLELVAPKAPEKTRVLVAHRPKSAQSDVYVATLAPERRSDRWAHVRVVSQVLGGGVAGRLFSDVREQRSLAYSTFTRIFELSHGPQPLVLYAGTHTPKTTQAIAGLLENMQKMRTQPPTSQETETARRYLSDVFAIRMETIGSIAEMVVTQETFGLPDGYWDQYRKELRATDAKDAAEMARQIYGDAALVVVAGDADVIGPELARFGEVTVYDPEKEFKVIKTIPAAK